MGTSSTGQHAVSAGGERASDALQARGRWFEPSCAHSQVRALPVGFGGNLGW